MSDTKTRLLDAAALCVQTRGYNGFSFHDLTDAVGIKTASIHYHFPTKSELGQALTRRYTNQFMTALGDAEIGPPETCLRRYVALFRTALDDGRMCLCGMMGAEVSGIPDEVASEVRAFFEANHVWLACVLERGGKSKSSAREQARLLVAALEGAMLVARVSGDRASFDGVAKFALALVKQPN
jgi:TetR/AcrR family transcriptional repressor of nem operon